MKLLIYILTVIIELAKSVSPEPMTQAEIEYLEPTPAYVRNFTPDDEMLLLKVAMLEGGNQEVEEIAKIMMTVINRVKDDRYPNTIREVIYQPNQYTVASRLDSAEPNAKCYEALEMVKMGYEFDLMHFYGDGRRNHFY